MNQKHIFPNNKYKQDKEQLVRAGFSAQQVQQLFPDAVTTVDGLLHIKLETADDSQFFFKIFQN